MIHGSMGHCLILDSANTQKTKCYQFLIWDDGHVRATAAGSIMLQMVYPGLWQLDKH